MANLRSFEDKARPSLVKQPNPKWKFGQGVAEVADGREWLEGEQAGWKYVDTAIEDSGELYKLMLSGIVPRPVAFVSSELSTGIKNLAPFSWFNMVRICDFNNPPVLSISASNVGASGKDTTNNIRATKQFVVNMISEPFIQQANATCIDTPEDVSEWPLSGLTQIDSTVVKPPRVKESVFSMECELFDIIDIKRPDTGESTTALILGLVKAVHVRKDVLNEKGRLDPAKYRPIARLGDISYTRVGDIFRVERPKWGDHAEEILALESKTGGRASL